MAVAAHVSRVAKDYAPYGYSIIEDVVVRLDGIAASGGATDDNKEWGVYVASAADSYIEGASIVFDVTTAANATWNAMVANKTATNVLGSGFTATQSRAAFTEVAFTIDQNQVIAKGNVLTISLTEVGTAGTALPSSVLTLRVRRKA